MKVKPKEILLNLPIVLLFDEEYKIPEFAANINQLVHGKVKVKYEELGILGEQHVGLFYLQRNDEFAQLRQEFITMIEQEEIRLHQMAIAISKVVEPPTEPHLDCGEIYVSKKERVGWKHVWRMGHCLTCELPIESCSQFCHGCSGSNSRSDGGAPWACEPGPCWECDGGQVKRG